MQGVLGVCRGCSCNTNRVREVVPKKPIALCLDCQKAWEESADKRRADNYVKTAEQHVNGHTYKPALIEGIISRAFMDFLYQLQKTRLEHGKQVGA